jgi:hypothetical protein
MATATPDPTVARTLPSGAVAVAGHVVAHRAGRVYLAPDGEPGGQRPADAALLAEVHAAARRLDPTELAIERRLEQAHWGDNL